MYDIESGAGAKLQRLQVLCQQMLASRRLIIASNRGPLEFQPEPDGKLEARRGSGGMVTALTGATRFIPATWVAMAMTDGDRQMAESGKRIKMPDSEIDVRFVVVPSSVYQRYYYVFSNPLLWFVQHYMWNTPRTPSIGRAIYEAWDEGYVLVNQAVAQAIVDETREDVEPPFVLLQDYHLYLAASMVRSQIPEATIMHFTHIPWPAPRYWGILPEFMRKAIHSQMCANDLIGLQTTSDVRNFLHCCEAMLKGALIDYEQRLVMYQGHTTYVGNYPISIDSAGLLQFSLSEEVERYRQQLRPLLRPHTIVRVDRSEPSKNILRGIRSFDLLLERYPEYRGEIVLLQFLVPSRSELGLYRTYTDEVFEAIEAINDQHGEGDWRPIHVFYENNYAQAIAGMSLYDVLMVNPVMDGMNLVSKEGPLVNKGDGVLVLSELAGSYEQLSDYALTICPTDLEGTVRALREALTMPAEERRRRAAALQRLVEEEDITFWLERQLRDLMAVARGGL